MVLGAGGAERGHGVGKARLRQGHHIHIAFNHQGVALLADRPPRFMQPIELLALHEERGLGGVQVLGLATVQHTPAKADDFALDRPDGKHDPVTKAVISFLLFCVIAVDDDQARVCKFGGVIVGKGTGQAAPSGRCVAEAEVLRDPTRQATALEVLDGTGIVLQPGAVVVRGLLQHIGERALLRLELCRSSLLGRICLSFGHLKPDLLGQFLDGIDETQARMLHEEADGIAMSPTTKAVIELLGWADRETGRFFPVEGAEPQQVGAAFAQRHMTSDDIDDVGPCNDFLDEGLWDLAA